MNNARGVKQIYNYRDDDSLSITDLLKKPEVTNYLEQGKKLTYASLREKIRKELRKHGNNFKDIVNEYNLENPVEQEQQRQRDTLYGSQRRRRNLPKKDTKGRVLFGPEKPPRPPRKPRNPILINGERLTAKQALEKYPQLREFLQSKRKISEKSLQAKYRAWMWKGKIPDEIIDPEPEIVPRGRLLGNNVLGQYTIYAKVSTSPRDFLDRTENVVIKFLKEHSQNKVQLSLVCIMVRFDPTTGNVIAEEPAHFNSAMEIVLEATDLQGVYERVKTKILESFSTYLKNGSGWVLKKVVRLDITLSKFEPMKGSSYIPLPKKMKNKGAIINMKNEDEYCFKYSIARSLNPVEKNPGRITKKLREQAEKLNWDGIEFPTPCSEKYFEKFGKNNNMSVLVFGYDDEEKIIPLHIPKVMRETVIRLFFQKSGDGKKWHYGVVKSMSRLVSTQTSKKKAKKYACDYCLNLFGSEEVLKKHLVYCSEHDAVKVKMPTVGRNILKFKNIQNMIECPIKIMFNFESFLEKSDKVSGNTELYQKHKPSAFCIYVVSRVEGFAMDPVTCVCKNEDEDVSKVFAEELEKITKVVYEKFKEPEKMIFDENAKKFHDSQHECYACGEEFNEEKIGLRKVRDHCHYTGKYRGALHSKCNLKLKKTRTIPVFAHNLTGYDSHLFVKRLADTQGNVSCIPRNEEKYITFTKMVLVDTVKKSDDEGNEKEVNVYSNLKFIDTNNFMQTSLEKLVKNMKKKDFHHTSKYFTGEKLDLMLRKGIYPYEYMDGVEKLAETELPAREKFNSVLNSGEILGSGKDMEPTEISEADYEHARNVFKIFECKNLAEYTGLYCKSDVLLLADVWESFVNVCLKKYGLDPSHYITSPSLFNDAMLKMTGVELELLTDIDMYLFYEKGVRGGISTVMGRYAKANNPYMDDYDPDVPTSYIQYLDANNLYGWAMSQPLPVGGFKWMSEKHVKFYEKNPENIRECVLEVDLEYPVELHDEHNEYPLAPEDVKVNGTGKLIPHLGGRKNYVVYYEALRQLLKYGLCITKIHRGIRFRESDFLSRYIDSNTKSRTAAKNEFEKDLYKLANNSVFGKTMENVRERSKIRIVNGLEEDKVLAYIARPNYKGAFQFEESNLVSVNIGESTVTLNKPIYLGQSILDLSKTLMYDFHYDYVKPKYGDNARLLFTDTDSLCYEIKTENFYEDIADDVPAKFDTSNYPKDHPIAGHNKKVLGMMKDEAGGNIITEYVGLRSKLYAYKIQGGGEDKKCKGVKKAVVRGCISLENYKDCLFNDKQHLARFNTFRSRKHEITTDRVTKVALSANDDKRLPIPNDPKYGTMAIGHWRAKHPAIYDLHLDREKVFKKGTLMNLAYNALGTK